MKKIDKFIKEKLDVLHDASDSEFTPFYSSEKNPKIAEEFAAHFADIKKREQSTKLDKNRKKRFAFSFTASAVALVLIGVFIIIGVLNQDNDSFYYNDEELISNKYSLIEFQEAFDVLLPDMTDVTNLTIRVYSHKEKNTNVHADIMYNINENDNIELRIIFVKNYILQNEQLYNSLEQIGQTALFSYNYRITDETEVSYAKFIYNNHKYYLKLNLEVSENIVDIIQSFN